MNLSHIYDMMDKERIFTFLLLSNHVWQDWYRKIRNGQVF